MNEISKAPTTEIQGLLGFTPARQDLAWLTALALAFLAFFGPALVTGEVFFFRDVCLEIVPKRWLLGQSPSPLLWNPYGFFGLPAAANSQWGALYPLNFIFHLGQAPQAVTVFIMAHFALALFSGYPFMRAWGRSPAAAAAGSLAFTFGGFFISLGNLAVVLSSAAWIMPLLWAGMMAVRAGRFTHMAAGGVFLAMQVLGGEPQIAYLSAMALALFLISRPVGAPAGFFYLKRCLSAMVVILALALGLSAAQWAPSLELASLSNRAGGLELDDALKWSLEPRALLTLLFPNYISTADSPAWSLGFINSRLPYILSIYPGLVALILAAYALVRAGRRNAAHGLSAAGFLALALGKYGLLYPIFFHVLPGFDRFRLPERCLFGFAVFISLLAASGLDLFREKRLAKPARPQTGSRQRPLALAALLVAGGVAALLRSAGLVEPPADLAAAEFIVQHRLELLSASMLRAMFPLSLFMALVLILPLIGKVRAIPALVVAVVFLDLFLAHHRVNPSTSADFYDLAADSLAFQAPDEDKDRRLLVLPSANAADHYLGPGESPIDFFREQRKWLVPFTGLELRLRDVGAKSSFYPADFDRWLEMLAAFDQKSRERLLARSGIHLVLRPREPAFKLSRALPRAFVVPEAIWVEDRQAALDLFNSPSFDPSQAVILEGPTPDEKVLAKDTLFWPLEIMADEPGRVEIMAPPDHAGWLVLLDLHYPGWEATSAGRKLKIERANGFFRAVKLGGDGTVIEFTYRPTPYYAGVALSLATLALVTAACFRRRYRLLFWPLWALILVALPMVEGGTTNPTVTALRLAALAMAAGWSIRLLTNREVPLIRTRLDLFAGAFWLLMGWAFLVSPYFYISFYWYVNLLVYLLVFYFTVQFTGGEEGASRGRRLAGLLVFGAAVQSAWAMSEVMAGEPRSAGGFFNPSYLAGSVMPASMLVLAALIGEASKRKGRSPGRVLGLALLLLLLLAGLAASGSRAFVLWPAAGALAAFPLVSSALRERGMDTKRAGSTAFIFMSIAVVILAGLLLSVPNPVKDRAIHIKSDPYAFERPKIWRASLGVIADHPLGAGLGMYKYHSPRHAFAVNVMAGRYERVPKTAHNEYLHTAAEMSPLAPLLLFIPGFWLMGAAIRRSRAEGAPFLAGLGAGLFIILAHSFFDSNLHNHSIAVMASALAALATTELGRTPGRWTRPADLGFAGRAVIAAALVGLLLAGIPLFTYLSRGFGAYLKAEQETDPGRRVYKSMEAARIGFGNVQPYKLLARSLLSQFQATRNPASLEWAIEAIGEARELNPSDPQIHSLAGIIMTQKYTVSGNRPSLDGAIREYETALAMSPYDVDLLQGLAKARALDGDIRGQIDLLERALELEPHDLPARLELMKALIRAGREKEAEKELAAFEDRRIEIEVRKGKFAPAFDSSYRSRRALFDPEELDIIKEALRYKLPDKNPEK